MLTARYHSKTVGYFKTMRRQKNIPVGENDIHACMLGIWIA
jgi:hypothetical protein